MATIKDTDLLLINRGGVDYKATAQDLEDYVAANGGGSGGGGGGSQNLQSVTDVGNTTTNGATFGGDLTVNGMTVGQGSGSRSSSNTAVGASALQSNNLGQDNTAFGQKVLSQNTNGSQNTAIGSSALEKNTGSYNTAVGRGALQSNTTGGANTAIGRDALYQNMGGSQNIAVGRAALYNTTTGKGNIGIGGMNSSGVNVPVFNVTMENDRIVMGSTSVTHAYVQVAWTVTSDARDKTSFAPVPYGLDFVKQLQPIAYRFKAGSRNLRDLETNKLIPVTAADELPSGPVRYGFKAQDILALEGANPVIIDNEDPDHLKYRGESLVPVLVNAIQEQQVLIDTLTSRLARLENEKESY